MYGISLVIHVFQNNWQKHKLLVYIVFHVLWLLKDIVFHKYVMCKISFSITIIYGLIQEKAYQMRIHFYSIKHFLGYNFNQKLLYLNIVEVNIGISKSCLSNLTDTSSCKLLVTFKQKLGICIYSFYKNFYVIQPTTHTPFVSAGYLNFILEF